MDVRLEGRKIAATRARRLPESGFIFIAPIRKGSNEVEFATQFFESARG